MLYKLFLYIKILLLRLLNFLYIYNIYIIYLIIDLSINLIKYKNINIFCFYNISNLNKNIELTYCSNNYIYINNDITKKIYIKKIGNYYLFFYNLNINKYFVSNILKLGIKKEYLLNILKLMNNYINFNKIDKKCKCIILLCISKNFNLINYNFDNFIGIKFLLNGKNYYIIKDINGNIYNINTIYFNMLKFPIEKKFRITSRFNLFRLNPITNKISPHKGIDIAIPIGTPILSIDNGIINNISFNKNAGKYIIIKHKNNYFTKYMHLNKILVKIGQFIKKGDLIALSGNSGRSTGPHLHFELWLNGKAIDPMSIKFYYLKNIYVFFMSKI